MALALSRGRLDPMQNDNLEQVQCSTWFADLTEPDASIGVPIFLLVFEGAIRDELSLQFSRHILTWPMSIW